MLTRGASTLLPTNAWQWIAFALATIHLAAATPIDNGVKGSPKVTCGLHSIRVDVDTERPFQGRVFVKGESYNKDCIKSFAGTPPAGAAPVVPVPVLAAVGPSYGGPAVAVAPVAAPGGYGETVGIELGFGQCNMRRQRTLFPRGVEYTFTLVVSFHPLFITKVDKAYRVRCFYMETEKTVAQQLEVSMLTTSQINEQFPMPQCRYHIKRGGPDGPFIRYARVGEPVHHVWECDAPASWLYGILVKNCYVDDGQGNRVELIDERGCANDRHILPDLSYDQSLISAWVESHVFKYADKPHLYFTCTIVLCFKQDGGCNGITPPNCLGSPVAAASYVKPGEPILPVPGPYPAGPVVPLGPGYGPRPPVAAFAPYNRDAPPLNDERNGSTAVINDIRAPADEEVDESSPPTTTTLLTSTAGRTGKTEARRQKRRANYSDVTVVAVNARKSIRDMIETDLSAQPVIVLPFEDDAGASKESEDELHDIVHKSLAQTGFRRPLAIIPNARGNGLPVGVCISSSGFGILVAMFTAMFVLSTTLTVFVVRRHSAWANSKL